MNTKKRAANLLLGLFLIQLPVTLHASCTPERAQAVQTKARELAQIVRSYSKDIAIMASECNIQLKGAVDAPLNQGQAFDQERSHAERDCQEILNKGLVRIYRNESLPLSDDFSGACVSFVRIRVPVGYGTR